MARRPKSPRNDGRRLRGGRTRRRLVESYLALVEEGDARPRAVVVADRAGVSLRTVYHHFSRLSDLAAAALESGPTTRLRTLPELVPQGTLSGRIEAFMLARGELFDSAAGITPATVTVGQPSRSLETSSGSGPVLRRQLERTFESELEAQPAQAGRALLDAVDAITSADAWAYVRDELGCTAAEARTVIGDTLTRLLVPPVDRRRRRGAG